MGREYKEEDRPRELGRDKKIAKRIGRGYKGEEKPSSLTLTSLVSLKYSETGTQRDSSN